MVIKCAVKKHRVPPGTEKLYVLIIFYCFLTFIIIHNAVVAAYKSLFHDKSF